MRVRDGPSTPPEARVRSSSGSSSNGSSGNSSSSEDQPPRSAVEAQLAPDGGTVRDYADKFSSILTGFIKKCVLESQAR